MKYYHKVWGVLFLGWMTIYMVRVGMSPVLVPIMKEFSLSYSQAGLLSSAVFWAYTFMQIPSGYLGDRFGHKRLLLGGAAGWSIFCLATGLVEGLYSLFFFRFLTGLTAGTYFGNDRPIIAAFTPPKKLAQGQGISAAGMGLGMGLGILAAAFIAARWGWRWVFIVYTIPCLAATAAIWALIHEPKSSISSHSMPWSQVCSVFVSKRLWYLYLASFANMYLLWVLGIWTPILLMEVGVRSLAASGLYGSLIGFMAIPALVLSGLISDRMNRRGWSRGWQLTVVLLLMAILSMGMGTGLYAKVGFPLILSLIALASFLLWSFFPPMFALIAENAPPGLVGTTFGVSNTIAFLSSLLAPWLTGVLRDQTQGFAWGMFFTGAVLLVGFLFMGLATMGDSKSRLPTKRIKA